MSSPEKEYFQKAFKTLKPACDAFITEPNTANSDRLKNALAAVPEFCLEQLQPYVLIPLEIHLKTNKYVCLWQYFYLTYDLARLTIIA